MDGRMNFDPQAVRAFEYAGWQRIAAHYGDTFAGATRPFVDALIDAAGVGPALRVLDVACGTGLATAAAAARGAMAIGLDFSPAMIAVARPRHPHVAFEEGDAEALPHADGAFDAVISNFGVHHAPRPEMALVEMHRVLAPRGRVAFTVWAGRSDNTAWRLLFEAVERHGDPAAARAPPPGGSFNATDDCFRALTQAGFGDCRAELVRREWKLAAAGDLIAALLRGTARMAALITAQDPAVLPAIEADVA